MEEQVNKLIEKIENDSISHYDFNEVLDMLKDLLVSNKDNTIKKGDKFLCVNNYIMDDKSIAYTKGKTYLSEMIDCITDDILDCYHDMIEEIDFSHYFIKQKK